MLEFKIETQEMVNCNKEPVLFHLFIFLLQVWGFITTGLVEVDYRFIPLSVMGLAMCFDTIYEIEKMSEASTVDHLFFK